MVKVYLAAPLWTIAEKRLNDDLTKKLEDYGHEVFLPQRDGLVFQSLAEEINKLDLNDFERAQMLYGTIFGLDIYKEIPESETLIANLDGCELDSGVNVELGVARNLGKKTIGFRYDQRATYGQSVLCGMHAFPAFLCDTILVPKAETLKRNNTAKVIDSLARQLDFEMEKRRDKWSDEEIKKSFDEIFGQIDMRSKQGQKDLVSLLQENIELRRNMFPYISEY